MTATALKNRNRERASHLARKLNMETDEFLNMVTAYVLDAVERTVSENNGLTLPLQIEIKSTCQSGPIPEARSSDELSSL